MTKFDQTGDKCHHIYIFYQNATKSSQNWSLIKFIQLNSHSFGEQDTNT